MSESNIENRPDDGAAVEAELPKSRWSDLWRHEDWLSTWVAGAVLGVAFLCVACRVTGDFAEQLAAISVNEAAAARLEALPLAERDADYAEQLQRLQADTAGLKKSLHAELTATFKKLVGKPKDWQRSPLDAVYQPGAYNLLPTLGAVGLICLVLFGLGVRSMGQPFGKFAVSFSVVFGLALAALILAGHAIVKWANLEYPLWALLVGLSISNTVGVPAWLKPAVRTEFYIKAGLVLLGAEILLSQLLKLGLPGICISWLVTPVVLVATYWFGQRVLKLESKTLNIVISADMSVCGVSAAIATAAACRAKKEELSLAIGISLAFTVVMMVLMPKLILALGINPVVGAAWIGGTIDATGAVAAAGEILGKSVLPIAVTVKMIQNILIGVIAFAVAVYWVVYEERSPQAVRPDAWEIWHRFPKFIMGFVAASALFSMLFHRLPGGPFIVEAVTGGCSKTLREWFFCLAFVSIGLESNFREMAAYVKGGKPIVLYVVGQSFSLILSLFMSWLMLQVIFPDAAIELTR